MAVMVHLVTILQQAHLLMLGYHKAKLEIILVQAEVH